MAKPATTKRRTAKTENVTLKDVIKWLEQNGTKKEIEGLKRYGITATKPFGVTVGALKKHAKRIGRDHGLAQELWATGRYEARMLATFVAEPDKVTVKQMNAWAADFDNWAIVDTACFSLFDRAPHAWSRIPQWAKSKREFTKRAAFALLWSLSSHDKDAEDDAFLACFPLIERGAMDDRNFVKKAVNMALRAVGKRNATLRKAAIDVAQRLAAHDDPAPRWVGSHALRELRR